MPGERADAYCAIKGRTSLTAGNESSRLTQELLSDDSRSLRTLQSIATAMQSSRGRSYAGAGASVLLTAEPRIASHRIGLQPDVVSDGSTTACLACPARTFATV